MSSSSFDFPEIIILRCKTCGSVHGFDSQNCVNCGGILERTKDTRGGVFTTAWLRRVKKMLGITDDMVSVNTERILRKEN